MAIVVRVPDPGAIEALAPIAAAVEVDGGEVLGLFSRDDADVVRARAGQVLRDAGVRTPFTVEPAEMLDWGSVWRPTLKALRVGPLYLAPDGVDAPGARFFEVGRAFGSGGHPTTRLCLEVLAEYPTAGRVLDVGTGNGILALAALWLGASDAVGTDTDPEALAVAARNAKRHDLADRLVLRVELPDLGDRFDRVVCNLQAAPVIELAGALLRRVAGGGEVSVSGFTTDQSASVAKAFKHLGASVVREGERAGWARLDIAAPW